MRRQFAATPARCRDNLVSEWGNSFIHAAICFFFNSHYWQIKLKERNANLISAIKCQGVDRETLYVRRLKQCNAALCKFEVYEDKPSTKKVFFTCSEHFSVYEFLPFLASFHSHLKVTNFCSNNRHIFFFILLNSVQEESDTQRETVWGGRQDEGLW